MEHSRLNLTAAAWLSIVLLCISCSGERQLAEVESEPPSRRVLEIPPRLTVELLPVREIGSPDGPDHSLLGSPRFVRTDQRGYVYVADGLSMNVKVYDGMGEYLRTVGGRGQRDGEFQAINAIDVNSNNELLVADGLNRTITRFDAEGSFYDLYDFNIKVMLWPRNIRQMDSGSYLFLFRLPEHPDRKLGSSKYLFHLFDHGFEEPAASFGDVQELGNPKDLVIDIVSQTNPGSFCVTAGGAVLYAPNLYQGRILRYESIEGSWAKAATYFGYVGSLIAYRDVDPSLFEGVELDMKFTLMGDDGGAIFHNESRGLFVLKSGDIVHFSLIKIGDERVFGVEYFDPEGNLKGYGAIERVAQAKGAPARLPIYALWKDDDDQFYIRDETDLPVIRVVRLGVNPEAPPSG